MEVRTEPVFDALKQQLALIENDERRRQIETYIEASRVAVERAMYDVLSQIAQGIDERTREQYRIRLAYRQGGLELEIDERTQNGEEGRWSTLEGDVEKITIRIPAELKDLATQAAARAGTSANTWFVKAFARALRNIEVQQSGEPRWRDDDVPRRGPQGRRGSRLSGWVGGDE